MGQTETHDPNIYYVPHGSRWPIIATLALFTTMIGAALTVNKSAGGHYVLYAGIAALVFMLFGWFGDVIRESVTGFYNRQVDISFRMGMIWFIFSEVMFFAAFFGALFYARMFSVPWLGGEGDGALTHEFIWNGYSAAWPTNGPAKIGGTFETIGAWGLPFLNTLILLTSGITVTIAHHALRAGERRKLLVFLGATVALGVLFLYYQATEYYHAYHELGLTSAPASTAAPSSCLPFPRHARDARHDHAAGDLVPLCQGPLLARPAFRLRSRCLVLAFRRRGLARTVPVRLRALMSFARSIAADAAMSSSAHDDTVR
jgi:cytochrome c oxidase subunit 3